MKIGIIGTGNIGATAAKLFTQAGHEVARSNARGPALLRALAAALGERARALTVAAAAKFGEVVLVSIPLGKYQTLPPASFNGKVVIDSNNYYPERDRHIAALDRRETTSSELLAAHLPGARVITGFNTIWSEHLKAQGDTRLPLAERRAIFIASQRSARRDRLWQDHQQAGRAACDAVWLEAEVLSQAALR